MLDTCLIDELHPQALVFLRQALPECPSASTEITGKHHCVLLGLGHGLRVTFFRTAQIPTHAVGYRMQVAMRRNSNEQIPRLLWEPSPLPRV